MKLFATALLLIITATALGYFLWYKPKLTPSKHEAYSIKATDDSKAEKLLLSAKARLIKNFAAHKNYDQQYCFLVDMHVSSGKKRFFVYNLQKDSIEKAGLVAHGSGSDHGDSLIFSNIIGSGCTSVGKYKIGKSYNGRFGKSYKLYGLDSTNSNAYKRFVVRSLGCPMVSPYFLDQLKPYIDQSKKPILLYIFY